MRVRFIKNHKEHNKGDTLVVSPNVGFGLIDKGVAIVSKDITESETKKKGSYGGPSTLRTYNSKRR